MIGFDHLVNLYWLLFDNFEAVELNLKGKFEETLQLLEHSNENIFITGKAGTGKSTLLNHFRDNTQRNVVVLAPTGVAALNVRGQTIHSFFKFNPYVTPKSVRESRPRKKLRELLEKVDMIVIDEVSMVRADLLDCIDESLRLHLNGSLPFGGKQMVFIGDLYQLSPVVSRDEREYFQEAYKSPYFFSAEVFRELDYGIVELDDVYRQEDQEFIGLLNKVRENQVNYQDLEILNQRYSPEFYDEDSFYITLTTTNAAADKINNYELKKLRANVEEFHADVKGDFERKHFPTKSTLDLKVGAQVMLLNNESSGKWANGSVGKIVAVEFDAMEGDDVLIVALNSGKEVMVKKHTWEISKYFWNKELGALDVDLIGSFTQFPVRLSWAVTIHKSQGKTFDRVIVDIGNGAFAPGQVYVALSRCRSMEGLILRKPIQRRHIWSDRAVNQFFQRQI